MELSHELCVNDECSLQSQVWRPRICPNTGNAI